MNLSICFVFGLNCLNCYYVYPNLKDILSVKNKSVEDMRYSLYIRVAMYRI